ncbi:MAG: alpha/beta hydrolase [Symploca sp. SIO2B6]|nr:alpha/beta hydrolase [Symploca sp. SIO2B6]
MDILLIHGLGRTPLSMRFLGRYLEQQGHRTQYFGYAAFAESYDQIVARLCDRLATMTTSNPQDYKNTLGADGAGMNASSRSEQTPFVYGIVAHSLGGLLARSALASDAPVVNVEQNQNPNQNHDYRQYQQDETTHPPTIPLVPPALLIMLGTPNQAPRVARLAWNLWPFQWFAGQCGANLANLHFFKTLPQPHFPYQIIAGTGGWNDLGSPFGSEPNDGLVALMETLISDRDSVLQFPVFHTFMMNNRAVQEAIAQSFASVITDPLSDKES